VSLTEEPGTSRTRRLGPEEMLGESAELYRLLAEHSTDMISKHTPEGFYTYASPACRSLLGYDPEELVGRDAYEFFHPNDLEEIKRTHSAILERPDTYAVGYRIRRKDGSYTWFETTSRTVRNPDTGEVLEIVTVSRDITERKRVEAKLREAEARYRTLVEQIPAVTYVAALDEVGSTIYISPQAESLLGRSRRSGSPIPSSSLSSCTPTTAKGCSPSTCAPTRRMLRSSSSTAWRPATGASCGCGTSRWSSGAKGDVTRSDRVCCST
jgi:PAS domain S-box-containing protein